MSIRVSPNEMYDIANRIKNEVDALQYAISSLEKHMEMIRDCGIELETLSCIEEYVQLIEPVKKVLPGVVSQVYGVIQDIERQRNMVIVYDSPRDDVFGLMPNREYPGNFLE